MQFTCPACLQVIEHQGARPRFCQHCGEPLTETKTDLADAATVVGPPSDDAAVPPVGGVRQLGGFQLLHELGRGGMGVVYEAEHVETGRRLALKVLSPNLPRNSVTVERFLREGRLAAAVSHPCSTFVYGAGECDGQLHIAMELVPGRTLGRVVQEEGPLAVNRAVDYILDVIDGLIAAHDVGVIHRDVKPSNCFLGEDDRVKVGDFGLSKSLVTDASLTRTGEFMGTPQYAAPEQVRGGDVDSRTDIYAVGATLYYLLSGRGPFVGDVASVIAQIASDTPPSLHGLRAAVPRELDRIVARSLAKEPGARFGDLAQFRQALLPFATSGVSIADLGRRMAAFFLDTLLCSFAAGVLFAIVFMMLFLAGRFNPLVLQQQPALASVGPLVILVLYFAIAEGGWGCAVGKRLLDLRVVNLAGESPGRWRAGLRALLICGASAVPAMLLPLWQAPHASLAENAHQQFLQLAVGWLATLAMLSTMRQRNNYRGLHELLSGTRVVRPIRVGDAGRRNARPVFVPVATESCEREYGTYRVTGKLGHVPGAAMFQAADTALERIVWVRAGTRPNADWQRRRINITRRARPMWLDGGGTDGARWDAFEAVRGAPLTVLLDRPQGAALEWKHCRLILLDLAEELAAAEADQTLPDELSLDQVWIEPGGRVKLLDAPLQPESPPSSETAGPGPTGKAENAAHLLQQAAEACARNQRLPVHAQTSVAELIARPAAPETLTWAIEQLRGLSHRHATLRWDDRLGVLAASTGVEQPVCTVAALAAAGLAARLLPHSVVQQVALAFAVALVVPVLFGFWFRGGPVFRLTGIEVRCGDRPASRLRCAWRSALAWGASVAAFSALGVAQQRISDLSASHDSGMLIVVLGWWPPLLAHALGALFSIVSPQRGVQDLLAGTSLAPR